MSQSEFYKLLNESAEKIFSVLGPGFKENIYQNALVIKLRQEGCDVKKEVNVPIFFENIEIGTQRLDLVVENDYRRTCIVELKTLIKLGEKEKNQLCRYLDVWEEDTGERPNGYLINFGPKGCEISFIEQDEHEMMNVDDEAVEGDDEVYESTDEH